MLGERRRLLKYVGVYWGFRWRQVFFFWGGDCLCEISALEASRVYHKGNGDGRGGGCLFVGVCFIGLLMGDVGAPGQDVGFGVGWEAG